MEGNKGEKMSMGEKWACLGQGATRQAPQYLGLGPHASRCVELEVDATLRSEKW